MSVKNIYCCSLMQYSLIEKNLFFDTPEEAEREGLKAVKEFKENYLDETFAPDDCIFGDELVELLECADMFKKKRHGLKEVNKFYIRKFTRLRALDNLGEVALDYLAENLKDEDIPGRKGMYDIIGEREVKELNHMIAHYIEVRADERAYEDNEIYSVVEVA